MTRPFPIALVVLVALVVPPLVSQENATEDSPRSFEVLQQEAVELVVAGETAAALERYEELQQLAPENGEVAYNRGTLQLELGRFEDAIGAFDFAVINGYDQPDAYYNRGLAHFRIGSYERAVADFTRSIDESEQPDPDMLTNRGAGYAALGRLDEAAEDYRMSAELSGRSDAFVDLATIQIERDEQEAALGAFDRALEIDPGNAEAFFRRGALHYRAGRFEQSYEDFLAYTELRPDDPDGRVNLGLSALAAVAGEPVRAGVPRDE